MDTVSLININHPLTTFIKTVLSSFNGLLPVANKI